VKIQATVHIRGFTDYGPSLNYVASLPPGYALRAGCNIGQAATSASSGPAGLAGYHSAWFLPPEWSFTHDLPEVLEKRQYVLKSQFQQLQQAGPLQVLLGERRSLFSITNNTGEVFDGFFELVGPPPAKSK